LFGVGARYAAAVPMVCQIVVQTIMALNFIRGAAELGLLPITDRALTEQVVVIETEARKEGRVLHAPLGTTAPATITEPFGEGWRRLDVDFVGQLGTSVDPAQ
jgi:hypothetical protein